MKVEKQLVETKVIKGEGEEYIEYSNSSLIRKGEKRGLCQC